MGDKETEQTQERGRAWGMETQAGPKWWCERGCPGVRGQSVPITAMKITLRAANACLELQSARH